MPDYILTLCQNAKTASEHLRTASHEQIDNALQVIANALISETPAILKANQEDLDAGKKAGLTAAFLDRLSLDEKRLSGISEGVLQVKSLPHPLGTVVRERTSPSGFLCKKVRVPLGVLGFIYESRPNVTVDAAILALKSGNAIILRGGKEAIHSNTALAELLRDCIEHAGLPRDAVQLMTDLSHERVNELLKMKDYVDMVIPRGGEGLIRAVVENATMPVLKHENGICHTYIDKDADIDMAVKIAYDAKMQRTGVCNAMETLLVHSGIASSFLPLIAEKLTAAGCEIRGDAHVKKILPDVTDATDEDWATEYLDAILSIRVVDSIDDAISHINQYGSKHSDGIVTENEEARDTFFRRVDSAAVFHNVSIRFHDGFAFGMGAEIGISTDKFHARGPVGLEELTSTKWIVEGTGQTRGSQS